MEPRLNILYRGPLSSCNYGCPYCPFAKHHETAAELADDRRCLQRFVDWLATRSERQHGILFTPWGEALTRRWYREAMVRISHMPYVRRVAVQTNLSVPLAWIRDANLDRFALWCTYHPGEVSRAAFLKQCRELDDLGVRYSVGVVGLREHANEIEALRGELAAGTYLWINAYKRDADYYDQRLVDQFTSIDPWFPINALRHSSKGQPCQTGETVISVDGQGDIRRCHFIAQILGNIYADEIENALRPRTCTNDTCGCHIGYVHMPQLKLDRVFGDGILERIPVQLPNTSGTNG